MEVAMFAKCLSLEWAFPHSGAGATSSPPYLGKPPVRKVKWLSRGHRARTAYSGTHLQICSSLQPKSPPLSPAEGLYKAAPMSPVTNLPSFLAS